MTQDELIKLAEDNPIVAGALGLFLGWWIKASAESWLKKIGKLTDSVKSSTEGDKSPPIDYKELWLLSEAKHSNLRIAYELKLQLQEIMIKNDLQLQKNGASPTINLTELNVKISELIGDMSKPK